MRPKEFQTQALETFEQCLAELKNQQDETTKRINALEQAGVFINEDDRDYFANTWQELGRRGLLPRVNDGDGALSVPPYVKRQDSRGRTIPHICMKLPTGGGKTLLGAAAIERLRPPAGLILWITPSRAIFRQTWRAFSYRLHPYRQALERACGGRVKLLKKTDAFTLADVENHLCIMPLMLQAADRQDRNFLRIFRDSGHYPSFFPEPDDKPANDNLLTEHPDLETTTAGAVKHSLFNVIKTTRPIIVLDEAHNAYTKQRRLRLSEFNPRFVLELSATPELGVSNILVDVPGAALKREEMIKLPLNIHNIENADWKYTLAKAKEKLDNLEQEACDLRGESGRYIRPIMLIRVERVGRDQRDGRHVHAEDVREYLITQLRVPENYIRAKTAEKDEIADEDLLSPYSTVRYILTKDALREGWDCPFAYVLTLLDSTSTTRALTQMTGRVLRQPDTELTGRARLDESYIYCFDRDIGEAIQNVKRGLEQEGMGDLSDLIRSGHSEQEIDRGARLITVRKRPQFQDMQLFLPQVLHRSGRRYRPLDYENDVLGELDWHSIATAPLDMNYAAIAEIREHHSLVDLPGFDHTSKRDKPHIQKNLSTEFFSRRIFETLPNPYLAGQVVEAMLDTLRHRDYTDEAIFDRRYDLSEILKRRLTELIEHESQAIFQRKLQTQDIRFELIADEDRFEFTEALERVVEDNQLQLFDRDGDPVQKSLYEKVYAREFNGLERDFAIYLDGYSAVTWWHRFAARQNYALQGWKRNRVYPDFVVFVQPGNNKTRRVLVIETKGLQLAGNADTEYKQKLFETLETAAPRAVEYGSVKLSKPRRKKHPMSLTMLFEDNYRQDFEKILRQGQTEAA
ncbi:MAG: DEAD/DEAH box helicase family protein [Gammaproteobacteria bacterium]|nr:DEAD/DEAH box helicase family protein [Gammaproteobacteria bacterium]